MENIKIEEGKGGIIRLTIDTSKSFGASKSGKTITIASTKGNKEVISGIFLGLNCYRYPEKD